MGRAILMLKECRRAQFWTSSSFVGWTLSQTCVICGSEPGDDLLRACRGLWKTQLSFQAADRFGTAFNATSVALLMMSSLPCSSE